MVQSGTECLTHLSLLVYLRKILVVSPPRTNPSDVCGHFTNNVHTIKLQTVR